MTAYTSVNRNGDLSEYLTDSTDSAIRAECQWSRAKDARATRIREVREVEDWTHAGYETDVHEPTMYYIVTFPDREDAV